MYRQMDRWQGDNFGWIVLRQMQPSLAVPAGYSKKCLVEFLQDFSSSNRMQLSNTNANANNGPSAFTVSSVTGTLA